MQPEYIIIILLLAIVLIPIIILCKRRSKARNILSIPAPKRKERIIWKTVQKGAYIEFLLSLLNNAQEVIIDIDYQTKIINWLMEREKSYKILRKKEEIDKTKEEKLKSEEILSGLSQEKAALIKLFSKIKPSLNNTLISPKELKVFNIGNRYDIFNVILENPKRILFNNKEGIFCGNFVLIVEGTNVRIEPYSDINLSETYTLENLGFSKSIARDDEIATTHWLHERKRGGPDRRYSYNPCSYVVYRGQITISYDAKATGCLKFSNRLKAHSAYLELSNLVKRLSTAEVKKIYSKMLKTSKFLTIEDISTIIEREKQEEKADIITVNVLSAEDKPNEELSPTIKEENKVVEEMEIIKRQPIWDIYESAVLLEACIKVQEGSDRRVLEKEVSEKLRDKAIFEGKTIDSTYRNINGIHWQMDRMLNLVNGIEEPGRKPSKCFEEAFNLYKSSKDEFYKLLKTANEKIEKQVVTGKEDLVVETIMPKVNLEENMPTPSGSSKSIEDGWIFLDFKSEWNLTFTKPELIVYFGEIDTNVSSWRGVYKSILKSLYEDYPKAIESLTRSDNYSSLSFDKTKMRSPILVCEGIYAEGNKNANDLIKAVKYCLEQCNVNYENVIIKYSISQKVDEFIDVQQMTEASETKEDKPKESNLSQIDIRLLEVIKEKYLNGFLVGAINFKKIRRFYNEKFDEELMQSNDEIEESLRKSCLYVNGKYYAADILMEDELKFQVVSFIQDGMLSNGYVFYENIISRFGYELTERIPDKELLKQFLQIILPQYVYLDVYMARDSMVSIDPTSEVERVLLEAVYPISVEKVKAQLPHLTDAAIQKVIWFNENIITTNGNERFHIDSMGLTAEDLKNIERHISELLEIHNYMFGNELLDVLRTKMSELYESIKDFGDRGIRGAIAQKLKGKFQFNANIICKIGLNIDNAEVFKAFALSEKYFTLEALINLKEQIGVGNIYIDAVNEVASRINATDYVPNDELTFATEQVDAAIEQIMQNRRMCSLKEASDFTSYPNACYPWTEYLLESYAFKYSERYKLLHVGFAEGKCAGAIVDKSSKILDLDDVVVEYLKNNINIQTSSEALTCLVEDGYIARKRYKNIEDLLVIAKSKRKEN